MRWANADVETSNEHPETPTSVAEPKAEGAGSSIPEAGGGRRDRLSIHSNPWLN